MDSLKRFFVTPYFAAQVAVVIYSVIKLTEHGLFSAWIGSLMATLPAALLFGFIMFGSQARTSENLPLVWICGVFGSVLAGYLPAESSLPFIFASLIGLLGGVLYVFWYSRYSGRDSSVLAIGKKLPSFTLYDKHGDPVTSAQITQTPALLMFFRGNWCPLCMAQIKEIADQYHQLDQRGVKVYLISPQSQENTQQLADRFSVPLNFLIDRDLSVSRELRIAIDGAVPLGVTGYDSDSIMPTVVLTDSDGEIIFADLTDNYRVRPEPSTFLRILDQRAIV
jgi:peroxiredoxin